jgi:probable HAF family extracellular repeat protein
MIVVCLTASARLAGTRSPNFHLEQNMLRMNGKDVPNTRRSTSWLPYLLGGVAVASAAVAGQTQTAATIDAAKRADAAQTTYRVTNLGAGDVIASAINVRGQVAYSLDSGRDSPIRAWFYDGTTAREIGTLGMQFARVTGLNDAGQVAGVAHNADLKPRAFVWSTRSGMVDLGATTGDLALLAINNRGEVAGGSDYTPVSYAHAFRWTAARGTEDLGALAANRPSRANAINDAGLIAGDSNTDASGTHAFVWTRAAGMIDIDTLGTFDSSPVAVGARGQVAGNYYGPGNHGTAFMWTSATGMRNLGTVGGATRSFVTAMSANGQVAGFLNFASFGDNRAMTWTRDGGMVDLGALGGRVSSAFSVNNKGQVVGSATTPDEYHAFVWTAKHGMIDLNKRLRNAPAGLTLDAAHAISDNGSIVASSNAGLVLLTPGGGYKGALTVGAIAATDLVQVGAAFDASVSFAAEDPAAKHNVIWSWGDGSGDRAGNARARNGTGSGSGSHTYVTPGIYTVTANVVDLAGKSVAVSRKIVAYDPAVGAVGGSGSFMSPQGTLGKKQMQAGKATFSFVAPSLTSAKAKSAKTQLHFNVPGLSFRSENLRPVAVQGARGQFEGSGTINGAGDYKFALDTTAGASGEGARGRFSLRIWHIDPATKAEVVDYDNSSAQTGVADGAFVEGKIAVQR